MFFQIVIDCLHISPVNRMVSERRVDLCSLPDMRGRASSDQTPKRAAVVDKLIL